MKKLKKTVSIVFVLALFLFLAFDQRLSVTHYTLESSRLQRGESLRIALITDLHSTYHGNAQQHLIEAVRNASPDVILLAGDIADDGVPIDGALRFLDGIQSIAPRYYVTGNHEYWAKGSGIRGIRKKFKQKGVRLLSDEHIRMRVKGMDLIIAGVEDPHKKWYENRRYNQELVMENAFSPLKEEKGYKILLAHRPEKIALYRKYPFDLVVSGHAHGGQVRIPFILKGLYAPNQGWFPPYAGGIYRHGALAHVVSRGLSINPRLPRIFNRPEVVVIQVKGTR